VIHQVVQEGSYRLIQQVHALHLKSCQFRGPEGIVALGRLK
jgi:hypothetical protein